MKEEAMRWSSSANADEKWALVPLHSDFDRSNWVQSNSGRCFGSTSTSMLRATLGCLLMNPARSSVSTIW